ncbi:MAG: hypothetical protein RLZZ15_4497 [Verrucomicrobiota bacterium]|jgi:predicted CopG family antitoxin
MNSTKNLKLETDCYELLQRERQPHESVSQTVRRLVLDRPVLTAGELLEAMKPFEGIGAGRKRRRRATA